MEGEVHVVARSVGGGQRIKAGVLPEVAIRVAILEQGADNGLGDVYEDQGYGETPRLALVGPDAESSQNNKVAHEAANDHESILGARVLLKPLIDRRGVVVCVIEQALDFEERHVRKDVNHGEGRDENADYHYLEDLNVPRRHLRECLLTGLLSQQSDKN